MNSRNRRNRREITSHSRLPTDHPCRNWAHEREMEIKATHTTYMYARIHRVRAAIDRRPLT